MRSAECECGMRNAEEGAMTLARAVVVAIVAMSGWLYAQAANAPTNDLPNPYQTVADYFKLPAGRTWGSTSAVDVDKDGKSIWVAERCGQNSCADPATGKMSPLDSVLKFDASGKLVKSFGAGMIAFAHGIHVDRDGNIWVTDARHKSPKPARGAAAGAAPPAGAAQAGCAACRGRRHARGRGQTGGPSGVPVQPRGQGAVDASCAPRRRGTAR